MLKNLKKEFRHHMFDYLILCTAGVLFLVGLNTFKGERMNEFVILVAFVSLYIVWSIHHHIIENTLRLKTLIEYILIGFTILFLMKIIIFP